MRMPVLPLFGVSRTPRRPHLSHSTPPFQPPSAKWPAMLRPWYDQIEPIDWRGASSASSCSGQPHRPPPAVVRSSRARRSLRSADQSAAPSADSPLTTSAPNLAGCGTGYLSSLTCHPSNDSSSADSGGWRCSPARGLAGALGWSRGMMLPPAGCCRAGSQSALGSLRGSTGPTAATIDGTSGKWLNWRAMSNGSAYTYTIAITR